MIIRLIFFICLVYICTSKAAIFGVDDRQYVKLKVPQQVPSTYQNLSESVAIAVLSGNRELNPNGTYNLLVDKLPLCSNEKFATDPSLSYGCSGFLIAPDILITAGHCVYAANTPNEELRNETGKACEVFTWLFDYQVNASGQTQTQNIPASKFAKCKEIIYAVQNQKAPFLDYAIIKLDRPMNRPYLKMAAQAPVLHEGVFTIGFPFGTPAKVSPNARVTISNLAKQSYLTNLDVFEGNSGSPVFNQKNEVIGILIAGTPSANTVDDTKNMCQRHNRCDQSGKNCLENDKDTSIIPNYQGVGSEVQRLDLLKKWL